MEMNCPAIHPFAEKGRRGLKIGVIIPPLSDFGNTNSFIKVNPYIHNIRTNLTLSKVLGIFQSNKMVGKKSK